MNTKKSNNFYALYVQANKKTNVFWLKSRPFVPVVAVVLILGAVYAAIAVQRVGILAELRTVGAYNNDAAIVARYDEITTLNRQNELLGGIATALEAQNTALNAGSRPDATLFTKVFSSADEHFIIDDYRYRRGDNTLVLYASAPNSDYMPTVVQRLRDTGLFDDVQYAGYQSDSDGRYSCTIGCTLAGAPGN